LKYLDNKRRTFMEKRRFVRLNKMIEVACKEIIDKYANPVIPPSVLYTQNISGGGLLLFSPKYMEKDTRLEFTIVLPDNKRGIDAVGKVLGSSEYNVEGIKQYRIKVNFTEINENDRDRLIKYILREDIRVNRNKKK